MLFTSPKGSSSSRFCTGLKPSATESNSLSLLVHLPGKDNATQHRRQGQRTVRNQSTVYCEDNALGPPATQRPGLWPAPSPGEFLAPPVDQKGEDERNCRDLIGQSTGRRGEQNINHPFR